MASTMPVQGGPRLGPYEIVAPLGQGGMGSVCGRGERAQRVEPQRVGVGPHAR
jgi:hypothetical protein